MSNYNLSLVILSVAGLGLTAMTLCWHFLILRRKEVSYYARWAFFCGVLAIFSVAIIASQEAVTAGKLVYFLIWSGSYWTFNLLGLACATVAISECAKFSNVKGGFTERLAWISILLLIVSWGFVSALMFIQAKQMSTVAQTVSKMSSSSGDDQQVDSPKTSYSFPKFNFEFSDPGSPWFKFDVTHLASDTVLGLMRTNPQTTFLVNAEVTERFSTSMLPFSADFIMGTQKERNPSFELLSRETVQIKGLDSITLTYEIDVLGKKMTYVHSIVFANNILYQFIIFSPNLSIEALNEELNKMIENLSFIKALELEMPIVETFDNKDFAYQMLPGNDGWKKWGEGIEKANADFSAFKNDTYIAMVLPYSLEGIDINLDTFVRVSLSNFQIDFDSAQLEDVKKVSLFGLEGYEFYLYFSDPSSATGTIYKKILVLKGKDRGYLMQSIELNAKGKQNKSVLDELLRAFQADEKASVTPYKELKGIDSKRHQKLLNELGLHSSRQGDFKGSLKFFKEAYQLNSDDAVVFQNYVENLIEVEEFKTAQQLIKKRLKQGNDQSRFNFWLSFIEYKIGSPEKAVEEMQKFHDIGSNDEYLLQKFYDILWEMEEHERLEKILKERFEKNLTTQNGFRLSNFYYARARIQDSLTVLRQLQENFTYNDEVLLSLINVLNQEKEYEEILKLTKMRIQRGQAPYEFHFFKAIAHYSLEQYRESDEEFDIVKQKSKGSFDVNAYVNSLKVLLQYTNLDEISTFIEPIALPEMLTESVDQNFDEEYSKEGAYVKSLFFLLDLDVEGIFRETVYKKIKILNAKELENYNEILFRYNSFKENLYVNSLNVFDEKGNLLGAIDRSQFYIVDDSDAGFASYNKVLHVPVPGLRVGSQIEYSFTRKRKERMDEFPYQDYYAYANVPTAELVVALKSNAGGVESMARNGFVKKEIDGWTMWKKNHIPLYRGNDLIPYSLDFMPIVALNQKGLTWTQQGNKYYSDIANQLKIDTSIVSLAQELTKDKSNLLDKVNALSDYVREKFTYNAIEFGAKGFIPNTAVAVEKNKYGDCKDLAVLLYSLLRAIDIDASIALANTTERIIKELPSLDQFNHAIVYCPGCGENVFIDPTDRFAGNTAIPNSLGGQEVLIIRDNASFLKKISDYPRDALKITSVREIEIEENDLVVQERIHFSNFYGSEVRGAFYGVSEADLHDMTQGFLLSYENNLILTDVKLENFDDPRLSLILNLNYRVKNGLKLRGNRYVADIPIVIEKGYLTYELIKERNLPFFIEYPAIYEINEVLRLPKQYKLASTDAFMSKKISYQDEVLAYDILSQELDNNAYQKTLHLRMNAGVYDEKLYKPFQSVLNDVLETMRSSLAIEER